MGVNFEGYFMTAWESFRLTLVSLGASFLLPSTRHKECLLPPGHVQVYETYLLHQTQLAGEEEVRL